MNNTPIWQWSATQILAAYQSKEVTVTQVVTAIVAHMRSVNAEINAISIDLGDSAIEQAIALDQRLAGGEKFAPMTGLPITIKHNVDVKGLANSNGVPAFQNLIAEEDSPLVERLKNAGAIVIGITNVPQFSMRGMTDNPIYGLTLNPWEHAITCGGSSGGAGAALAAGVGPIAHGSDIGGSLRWPAYCCGVYALRPTMGRIPAYNATASTERPLMAQCMSVHGPMARTVDDLALGLTVMAGFDPRDPWSVPAPLNGDGRVLSKRVAMVDLNAIKDLDPSVRVSMEKAAAALVQAGYEVSTPPMPDWQEAWQGWVDAMGAEIQELQWEGMKQISSDQVQSVLKGIFALGNPLDIKGYMTLMQQRNATIRKWLLFLEDYPLVLAPVSIHGSVAVDADLGGVEAVRAFGRALFYALSVNFLGLPAVSVPIDVINGRPTGVQLIATRFREDACLSAAKAIEMQLSPFYGRFEFPKN